MAIAGYTRPQLLIRQVLEVLPDQEERTLHAFSVGPQYDLHRYTNADERAEKAGVAFVENANTDPAARQLVPYEGLQSRHVVDQAFTRIYGENLEGQVLLAESAVNDNDPNIFDFRLQSLLYPNRIQVTRRQAVITATHGSNGGLNSIVSATLVFGGSGYAVSTTIDQPVIGGTGSGAVVRLTTNSSGVVTAVSVVAPGTGYTAPVTFSATAVNSGSNVGHVPDAADPTPLVSDLHGRPIKSGDVVYATLNGDTVRRTVREVVRQIVASKFGTDSGKADKKFASATVNPIRTDTSSFGNASAPASWGVELTKGAVLGIQVTAGGSGYTSAPDVEVQYATAIDSGGFFIPSEDVVASAVVNDAGEVSGINVDVIGAGYYVGGIVGILILDGGSGYSESNPPRIVTSTPSGGEAAVLEAVISGGQITGVKILNPGWGHANHIGNTGGYSGLSLVGGAGTGATIIGVANLNAVLGITILNHGTGYDDNVVLGATGGGTDFAAKAYFGANSATVDDGGTGYAIGDIAEVDGGTTYLGRKTRVRVTGETAGVVTDVEIVEDYEGNYDGLAALPIGPNETTTAVTGGGTGLELSIDMGIWLIRVLNPGKNYSPFALTQTPDGNGGGCSTSTSIAYPVTVNLTGGGGTGATASLVMRSVASDWDGLVEGSTYDNKYGERYTITVTKAGSGIDDAEVRIRSASGAFSANSVKALHYGLDYVISDPALGGLTVSLRPPSDSTPLKLGDTFTFVVTGAYLPLELAEQGRLLDINVIANGTGYTPGTYDLVIAAPPSGGTQATARVTVGGGGAVTPASLVVTNPGSGYQGGPTVALPVGAGAGTGAVFEAVITTAETSRDLTVVQSGVYTGPKDTRYQVKVIRGTDLDNVEESFNGAVVRVSDTAGIDEIQEYTITQGQQYDLGTYGLKFMFPADQATPSGIVGGTTATGTVTLDSGAVVAVVVTDQGSGYTVPPTVTIGGDGAGATAEAVLHAGKVIAIVITNAGSGYSSSTVTIGAPYGYQGGLRTGDTYYVDAIAEAASGPYSIIVLNGQATDITGWVESDLTVNKFDLDVRTLFNGLIEARRNDPPNLAWEAGTATDGGVFISANLAIALTDRDAGFEWVPVKDSAKARLFSHWRGMVPATSGDKIKLYYSEEGIIEAFGKKDMDNPACYGACMAFLGGQEKPVFAARLASNDVAGHTALIRQAEHVEGIYSICLTTYDRSIQNLWAAHVSKMSQENWKLWRRLYVGTQNPGKYVSMATKSDGTDYIATVTTNASGNVRVVCADGDFLTRGVLPGDLFRTNFSYSAWGDLEFEEYEVYTVNSEDELILKTGPSTPINPAAKFEIWKPDNGLSQATYAGEKSDAFQNRRVVNVWCDEPTLTDADSNILPVPVYYLACEVAGLRSAVLPQQGLTYTELEHSLDAAPLMFTKYSEEELNVAAANGTWIITQEQEDGPLFIRHQLTTNTSSGILYYEDSIGTNLDNIAYAVKDIFQPYIGRRNVNVETLEELETKLRDLLDSYKKNPGGFTNIGPALIAWSDLSVTIDPVFKDRINSGATLELPLPVNTAIVTLRATTASDETVASINITVNAANAAA